MKFAPDRSAFASFAPASLVEKKSAPCRSRPERSTPERSRFERSIGLPCASVTLCSISARVISAAKAHKGAAAKRSAVATNKSSRPTRFKLGELISQIPGIWLCKGMYGGATDATGQSPGRAGKERQPSATAPAARRSPCAFAIRKGDATRTTYFPPVSSSLSCFWRARIRLPFRATLNCRSAGRAYGAFRRSRRRSGCRPMTSASKRATASSAPRTKVARSLQLRTRMIRSSSRSNAARRMRATSRVCCSPAISRAGIARSPRRRQEGTRSGFTIDAKFLSERCTN